MLRHAVRQAGYVSATSPTVSIKTDPYLVKRENNSRYIDVGR